MAGVAHELVNVLREQKECYEGLYTLATYKARAVVEKDIDFLKEVVSREEEFIGRVDILDRKREGVFKDISQVTGLNLSDLTLTKIINKIGPDKEISKELIKIRKELLVMIEKVKNQNDRNKKLIKQSMEFVEFTLNAIQTTRLGGIDVGYSRPGFENIKETRRVFDARR
ncbi:MAG: hypothetical protein ATN31_04835 [Candidatus Epulonipiscioides saccharophilum]|nr:MAG: hypothetical protein ATN31_04835 [Epulopiscium sp. AS2M-Bin001]